MRLDALIAVQFGIARREQLLSAGLSPETIRLRLERGEWQSIFATVYALSSGPLNARRRQVAAWLYAGPGAQLAGPTAARMYGLRNAPAGRNVHLLVPHHRQVASTGFAVVHRTVRLESRPRRVAPLAVCSAARAVADTARWYPDARMVRALVCEAIERRFVTPDALRAECSAGRRNGSGLLRLALDEIGHEPRRTPEQDLRVALLQSRELPGILWRPRLVGPDGRGLPWVDGWIEDVGIGLEVDAGVDTSPDEWERAARRHTLLAQHGVLVLQFPAARVRRDPIGVRTAVERAYRHRRARHIRARVSATVGGP